jgi:hypothetical protein
MAKRPSQAPKDMDKFLNRVLAETVITMQSELGSTKVSPVDTGRFRSSWFVSEGVASNEVAPEADAKAVRRLKRSREKAAEKNGGEEKRGRGLGSYGPNADALNLRMDWRRQYHLTNNLPYAQAVAIEGRVVAKPKTWFHDFMNSRVPKIIRAATRVAGADS